ncbi:MAG: hypothetical protein QRY16_20350 [Enterobacterales bacterium endosymbiont of Blomia tropicalis]|uniref:hypothetical protein n=1 Tax=Mixta mediterraneensis TaxID=2758443 RepID=UPI0025A78A6B|nr:hypothetical protein [Mixta mediterraneensis]MDL4916026.1 hypothetical protein [Mixta mediterraneensis]
MLPTIGTNQQRQQQQKNQIKSVPIHMTDQINRRQKKRHSIDGSSSSNNTFPSYFNSIGFEANNPSFGKNY